MYILFDYNRTLYNPDIDALYDGVRDLLATLSVSHTLYLMSRFEPNRSGRLDELGIRDYFSDVAFVADKTIDAMRTLLGETTEAVVIGDCVFDEIRIGNELGFTTVWVQQGKFAARLPEHPLELPTYIVPDIAALTVLLPNIMT